MKIDLIPSDNKKFFGLDKFDIGYISTIMLILVFAVLCSPLFTWASLASVKSWNHNQHITLYSNDGKNLGEWDSDGQIQNESGSDGFHFMDNKTKKQVRLSGTTIVTTQ